MKKNNKGLILIVVVLFLIIIGLLCYILFDKNVISENNNTTTTLINTTTTVVTTYKGNPTGKFNLKIEPYKLYQLGEDYQIDYDIIDYYNVETNYNIISDGDKVRIEYKDGYNKFFVNNKEIGNISSSQLFILSSVKMYNKFLIVGLACACDIPSRSFAIDLNNEKVISDVCYPNDDGVCTDYSYEYVGDAFLETEFNVDYNSGVKSITNKEEVKCNEYPDWDKGDSACNNDAVCIRRRQRCYAP